MPKFCGKCGTKLDESTGICPKCNWKTYSQIKNNSVNKAVQPYNNTNIPNEMDSPKNTVTKKFCGKCGSKIDSATGLCQKCNLVKTVSDFDDESADNKSSVVKKIITGLLITALLAIIAFLLIQGRVSYFIGGPSENTHQDKTFEEFYDEMYGDLSVDEQDS